MPVERVFLIYWALLSGEETGLWSTGHGYGCGVYLRGVAHGVLLEYLFLFLSLVSFLNNVFKHRRWVLFFLVIGHFVLLFPGGFYFFMFSGSIKLARRGGGYMAFFCFPSFCFFYNGYNYRYKRVEGFLFATT